MSLVSEPSSACNARLLVACLCAQWCRTCDDYLNVFQRLHQEFPDASFRWIDIEDDSDLVDPIEVENFPTVLIAAGGNARFFGTVTPHIDTLRRLIQAQLETAGVSGQDAAVQALADRLLRSTTQ